MKKLLFLFGLCLIIALGLYYYKGKPSEVGFDLKDRSFKITNVEDIGVIYIDRVDYPKIIFTKTPNGWQLNNGRYARTESIGYMTNILKKLTLKYIPNRLGSEGIKERIKKDGIVVKIYDTNSKLMKSFTIGPDMGDGDQTAFLMEGATQPYVMFVPSYDGSIRTRFEFEMNEYETKTVFNEDATKLKSVTVKYPRAKSLSYTIQGIDGTPNVVNAYTLTPLPKVNNKSIEAYLSGFNSIGAEYNDSNNAHREEILKSEPFAEISIVRKDGSKRMAIMYSLDNIEFDAQLLSPTDLKPQHKFMVLTDQSEFFLVQARVINKILSSYEKFSM
jgi:hypothetical protein